jgi:GntR family transcriptional regulator
MITENLPYSPTEPLYARLKIAIRQTIAAGMKPGDQLPTEAELCRQYGVSRITVREAMQVLETEGVVVRRQGRGTYVADERRREPATYFGSLADEFQGQGKGGSSKLVSSESLTADLRISDRLKVAEGSAVFRIRRIRLAYKQPICYQVSYLPRALLGEASQAELRSGSLYPRLERLMGERIDEADEVIEIVIADRYRADRLNVKVGSPLLLVERIVKSHSGRTVEFSRSFYNPKLVCLTLHSQRAPESMEVRRLLYRGAEDGEPVESTLKPKTRAAARPEIKRQRATKDSKPILEES